MKLTIEEGNYLEELVKHTKELYDGRWERILEKEALPLPRRGFNEKKEKFEEFDPGKEEKVIKQLQEKNIVTVREEETRIQRQGQFQEKYGDQNNQFIGINPEKMEELKEQLDL